MADGCSSAVFATVTINVTESAPVANNDSYTTSHDRTLSVSTYNGVLSTTPMLTATP